MRVIELVRSYLPDRTVGVLSDANVYFKTLERPWRSNMPNISCIPEGVYVVKRDKTGKHQFYAVQNVEGRSAIEFHAGNFVEHSAGCILVGKSFNKEFNLVNSNNAISELLEVIGDSSFILNIRAATRDDM